jgi:hypothetical protein
MGGLSKFPHSHAAPSKPEKQANMADVESALRTFDFANVHKAMVATDCGLGVEDTTPSVEALTDFARQILMRASQKGDGSIRFGRFVAGMFYDVETEKQRLGLMFVLERSFDSKIIGVF